MSLFQSGTFKLHSGGVSQFKIDCDYLTDADIATLAKIIKNKFRFSEVYGIPKGGVRLAIALEKYSQTDGGRILVDDVFTTGASMKEHHQKGDVGVVIFARSKTPYWIHPIFTLGDF